MGQTTTPTYRVETRCVSCRARRASTPMEWRVRDRHGSTGYGKPTQENLQRFLDKMNASMDEGGVNAHLRDDDPMFRYVAARIVRQRDGKVMAEVGLMQQPAFEIVA